VSTKSIVQPPRWQFAAPLTHAVHLPADVEAGFKGLEEMIV
jgi:hypothetical protein